MNILYTHYLRTQRNSLYVFCRVGTISLNNRPDFWRNKKIEKNRKRIKNYISMIKK